ncbi:uncharacterized protein [Aristolochia californica]|uniref:uncharacterized protein n=1 Tax=Aristolochia californica TaxID=171875 RepID=UPI0035E12159
MADFGGPSFSLGLDLDFDYHPNATCADEAIPEWAPNSSDDEDGVNIDTLNPDQEDANPPPSLKRLKRGPATQLPAAVSRESVQRSNLDDEIEDFSSEEEQIRGERGCGQTRSACSSSKYNLRGQGVLTTRSTSKSNPHKSIPASNASNTGSLDSSRIKGIFPNITISPLRKIQFLDSDSDEPSMSNTEASDVRNIGVSSKGKECKLTQPITKNRSLRATSEAENARSDLAQNKNINFVTPALDQFCEEYFTSMKGKRQDLGKKMEVGAGTSNSLVSEYFRAEGCFQNTEVLDNRNYHWNLPNPAPPAYRYFNHSDPRVRELIRNRLPNFSPIGVVNNRENQYSEASVIDYTSQFGNKDTSVQICKFGNDGKEASSGRKKQNARKTTVKKDSPGSVGWVNPKSCDSVPKDAGRRRVHASDSSRGHWYTDSGGKKVYVNKKGQELTGRAAYRLYKKENDGFKKTRKKSAPKKKPKNR